MLFFEVGFRTEKMHTNQELEVQGYQGDIYLRSLRTVLLAIRAIEPPLRHVAFYTACTPCCPENNNTIRQ